MDRMRHDTVVALDLEGTLISNAMSQIPRHGLFRFLELCERHVHRVVLYTAVRRELAIDIVQRLAREGDAPSWLASIEYVEWSGSKKDLRFVDAESVLLVDDQRGYILASQEDRWIAIQEFEPPYTIDHELQRVWRIICERLGVVEQW